MKNQALLLLILTVAACSSSHDKKDPAIQDNPAQEPKDGGVGSKENGGAGEGEADQKDGEADKGGEEKDPGVKPDDKQITGIPGQVLLREQHLTIDGFSFIIGGKELQKGSLKRLDGDVYPDVEEVYALPDLLVPNFLPEFNDYNFHVQTGRDNISVAYLKIETQMSPELQASAKKHFPKVELIGSYRSPLKASFSLIKVHPAIGTHFEGDPTDFADQLLDFTMNEAVKRDTRCVLDAISFLKKSPLANQNVKSLSYDGVIPFKLAAAVQYEVQSRESTEGGWRPADHKLQHPLTLSFKNAQYTDISLASSFAKEITRLAPEKCRLQDGDLASQVGHRYWQDILAAAISAGINLYQLNGP